MELSSVKKFKFKFWDENMSRASGFLGLPFFLAFSAAWVLVSLLSTRLWSASRSKIEPSTRLFLIIWFSLHKLQRNYYPLGKFVQFYRVQGPLVCIWNFRKVPSARGICTPIDFVLNVVRCCLIFWGSSWKPGFILLICYPLTIYKIGQTCPKRGPRDSSFVEVSPS